MPEYDYKEQDTRTKLILPKLNEAGWNDPPHSFTEEKSFTDGRIVVMDGVAHRREPKIADYILRLPSSYTYCGSGSKKIP